MYIHTTFFSTFLNNCYKLKLTVGHERGPRNTPPVFFLRILGEFFHMKLIDKLILRSGYSFIHFFKMGISEWGLRHFEV